MTALVFYLFTMLLHWAPPSRHAKWEGELAVRNRYVSIAEDVAAVVGDPAEPPLYPGANGRERGAVVLLAVAFQESGLLLAVDDGSCNRRGAWCDRGWAWSIWQIHTAPAGGVEDGITLDGAGFIYARDHPAAWKAANASAILHGPDLVHDRRVAARVALRLARRSLSLWTQGANARALAQRYVVAHPMKAD